MNQNWQKWVIAPVVTLCAVGIVNILLNMNTHDQELRPIERAAEAALEQGKALTGVVDELVISNQRITQGIEQQATQTTMSGYVIASEKQQEIEVKNAGKPMEEWSAFDQKLHDANRARAEAALEAISSSK